MAKKVKAKSAAVATAVIDDGADGGIPAWLLVANRQPLTAAQAAKCAAWLAGGKVAGNGADRVDWRKPRSLSWDDWDMHLAAQQRATEAKKAERVAALQALPPKPPSARAMRRKADGMLDAHHFAKVLGCEAKLVRRALRTTKALAKPDFGWCFSKADEPKVLAVVKAWLAKRNGGNAVTGKAKGNGRAHHKS